MTFNPKRIAILLYRVALRIWWPVLDLTPRISKKKRVLVCAESDLMVEHLLPVVDLIRHDPNVRIQFVSPTGIKNSGTTAAKLAARMKLPVCGYAFARFQRWDLILFAEHAAVNQFSPNTPKLLVQHGFDSGKIFSGVDIRYSREFMYASPKSKTPRYASMLEPSFVTQKRAVENDPLLKGRIAVVGDIGTDEMMELNQKRSELRKKAGYSENDTVVLIMGTWQGDSLMETIGEEIVAQSVQIKNDYRFIFSTHPRHWNGTYAKQNPWGQYLCEHEQEGLDVLRQSDSWDEAAVICDMAISDHTSVGVKYALLGKPLMYIARREGLVSPGTFGHQLYESLPRLNTPSELRGLLQNAQASYPYDELKHIAQDINAFPGDATKNVRTELYRLLEIPEPTTA